MFAAKLKADPVALHWWSYLTVHSADRTVIGTCGYKGPPAGFAGRRPCFGKRVST